MIALTLDPATERRLADIARFRGTSEAELVRDLIEASLDDIEDIAMATERLANPLPPVDANAARAALGLDN